MTTEFELLFALSNPLLALLPSLIYRSNPIFVENVGHETTTIEILENKTYRVNNHFLHASLDSKVLVIKR